MRAARARAHACTQHALDIYYAWRALALALALALSGVHFMDACTIQHISNRFFITL